MRHVLDKKMRLDSAFQVWGSGFRVWGLGFRVWGVTRVRVWG